MDPDARQQLADLLEARNALAARFDDPHPDILRAVDREVTRLLALA